jgi:hypothetical protein
MMKNLLIVLTLLITTISFSQEKFEKEYRIDISEAPENSQQIIKMWNFPKKIKWYAEESNDGKTFEAKTCFQKHRYSIEFAKSGEILDVEQTVKFKELHSDLRNLVLKKLQNNFKKFKIKKTQIQFKGEESTLYKMVFELKLMTTSVIRNYELIVKAKKDTNYELYEILFDENGNILKELKFKPTNSLNLEF